MVKAIRYSCIVWVFFNLIGCTAYSTLGMKESDNRKSVDWSKQENLNLLVIGSRYKITLSNGKDIVADLLSVNDNSLSVMILKEEKTRDYTFDKIHRIAESRVSLGMTIGMISLVIALALLFSSLGYSTGFSISI